MGPLFDGIARALQKISGGGNKQLIDAIDAGDLSAVDKALADGANANARDDMEQSVLARAARKNKSEIVSKLLDAGAAIEIGYRDSSPLLMALVAESRDAAKLLISRGADVKAKIVTEYTESDCLGAAASARDSELVQDLIARGCKFEIDTKWKDTRLHGLGGASFWLPLGYGKGEINRKDYAGNTPLHLATREADYKALVENGANLSVVNDAGHTPLFSALSTADVQAAGSEDFEKQMVRAQYLIDHGADVHQKNKENWNLMHFAAFWGNLPVMIWLHERGVFINEINGDNFTPLALAGVLADSKKDKLAIHNWLVERGAIYAEK